MDLVPCEENAIHHLLFPEMLTNSLFGEINSILKIQRFNPSFATNIRKITKNCDVSLFRQLPSLAGKVTNINHRHIADF